MIDWPSRALQLNLLGRIRFIWQGLAPVGNVLNLPLQFLTIAIFISALFSQYPALSFIAFVGKYLKVVFLYFTIIEAFNSQRPIGIFLKVFMFSAFLTASFGVIQHFTGFNYSNGYFIGGDRINSFFGTANGLGAYLLPVIAIVTHFLFRAINCRQYRILTCALSFFLVLLLVCLCWSYSRSAWIGYLVILFVTALLDRRKLLFVGAFFLIFVLIFLPSLNNARHLQLTNDHDAEVIQKAGMFQKMGAFLKQGPLCSVNDLLEQGGSGRLAFWKKAVSIIRLSPVYGTGLNTYTRMIKRDPDRRTWWYAHNSYLQMAAETGLLGLACFLWMVFVLLRYGFNSRKQIKASVITVGHPDAHRYSWQLTFLEGALSGLLGYLAQSFFDNTLYAVQLNMFMWVIIGMMVAVSRLNENL